MLRPTLQKTHPNYNVVHTQYGQQLHAIRRATWVNASVNIFLALAKIGMGYGFYSHVLMADGFHSLADLATTIFVFFAAKMGQQAPDSHHPYGHRRVETLGSLVIGLLLISTALGISWDAYTHMIAPHPIPAIPALVMAALAIIANEFLFRYTRFEAIRAQSPLLHNQAWHNRSDMWVSLVTLSSLVGAYMGFTLLDGLGALVIAILILYMGTRMFWHALREVIDTGVDEATHTQLVQKILKTPGVKALHQLRTRLHAERIFLDVHVQVHAHISVSEGHYIGEMVGKALCEEIPHVSDVTVHVDPENDERYGAALMLPPRPQVEHDLQQAWHALSPPVTPESLTLHYLDAGLEVDITLAEQSIDSATHSQYANNCIQAALRLPYVRKARVLWMRGSQ